MDLESDPPSFHHLKSEIYYMRFPSASYVQRKILQQLAQTYHIIGTTNLETSNLNQSNRPRRHLPWVQDT